MKQFEKEIFKKINFNIDLENNKDNLTQNIFNQNILKLIKKKKFLDMTSLLNNLLEKKIKISAYPIHEQWLDLGLKSQYDRLRKVTKKNKCHFSKNHDKRPGIFAFQITRPTNLGTFVLTRRKVAENEKPFVEELRQTSQDVCVSDHESHKSWDVCPNSPTSVKKKQLFEELGQTSQDFCVSDHETRKSWDVCANSPKNKTTY